MNQWVKVILGEGVAREALFSEGMEGREEKEEKEEWEEDVEEEEEERDGEDEQKKPLGWMEITCLHRLFSTE